MDFCFLSIDHLTVFFKVNQIGRVCAELPLSQVSLKRLLQQKIYTCESVLNIFCSLVEKVKDFRCKKYFEPKPGFLSTTLSLGVWIFYDFVFLHTWFALYSSLCLCSLF